MEPITENNDFISVILCTYNPDLARLTQTINGLKDQLLPLNSWELIIVDNNSVTAVNPGLGWHPNHKIIRESKPGLTNARLKGFAQATGAIIVMVDDDNILDNDYLQNVFSIFRSNDRLGAIGGKSIPLFEQPPPVWLNHFYGNLALRDPGENILTAEWNGEFPAFAPIGAGMGVRKEALKTYIGRSTKGNPAITDRIGISLSSGGDNDIIIEILKSGWQVGYYPMLRLQHIIPEQRTTVNYIAKLVNSTNKSWVRLLEMHQINPWKKINKRSAPFRKIKAWFSYKAWQNKVNYIKWYGACGLFDGLSE